MSSPPPDQGPMMSPDGKWVWNGQQWVPVAHHESVFAAYSRATAAAADAPVAPAAPAPASPFGPPPAGAAPRVVSPPIVQPLNYQAGDATPPWQMPAGGKRTTGLYIGAGLVAVLIGVVLIVAIGQYVLPFINAGNGDATPTPKPSPTPQLASRSQSAIADRFIKYTMTPALTDLGQATSAQQSACSGQLSFSCQDALTGTQQQLAIAQQRFSGVTPPPCIAALVAKVQADLTTMTAGVQQSLKSFKDNNRNELKAGLGTLNAGTRALQGDSDAIVKAQTTTCNAQLQGP